MSNLTLDLSGIVNEAIEAKMSQFDIEGRIKELLGDVSKSASKVLTVKVDGKSGETKLPLVHKQFEQLLNVACIKGLNVLLTGGAGLSKSTAVEQLATSLQLELASISFSNQTTKTDLLGFIDANGIYRMSGFIDAFKNGKIFLADEMDACSSNVLVLLNSAIANGRIETPDNKVIHAHDNFRFIATANTNLRGAKNGYTARNKLDTATIDRFVVIEWELDLDLEQKLTNNDGWLEIVRTARKSAEDRLEGITITPRSSYDGAKLIQAGINIEQVIKMTIIKAMGKDEEMVLLRDITKAMKDKAVKVSKKEVEAFKEEVKEIIIPTVTAEVVETEEDDFKW
jgi:MoxR-like ATPase